MDKSTRALVDEPTSTVRLILEDGRVAGEGQIANRILSVASLLNRKGTLFAYSVKAPDGEAWLFREVSQPYVLTEF